MDTNPTSRRAPEPGMFARFASRRSVVYSTEGMVASTQPLASVAGRQILQAGGNAADAAVAVAAALNVTEPCSTGIGGDMFCLFWHASTRKVHALNGSGRSPQQANQPLSVTVPGAAAGWVDTIEKFGSGKLSLADILQPAIKLARKGFPVSESAAFRWRNSESNLKLASPNSNEMLKRDVDGSYRAPGAGEILRNPALAETFETLAKQGKSGFYEGRIAQSIVEIIQSEGGFMQLSDLANHAKLGTEEVEPISLKYYIDNSNGQDHVELWENPPNGQGLVALMTLGILQRLQEQEKVPKFSRDDHNTVPYLHALIEALEIAFADGAWWITDLEHSPVAPNKLLSKAYLDERAGLFDPTKAQSHCHGQPGPSPAHNHSDTVYFAVADANGNAISFINSNYDGFGSHIIPKGCGFTLQNRASNFNMAPDNHPNIYAPGKRPYHTIIPGLTTIGDGKDRKLHSVYGVMGGFMQPQGHVQVLLNQVIFGMNPQEALDAPRICISAGTDTGAATGDVFVEDGIGDDVVQELQKMGHKTKVLTGWARSKFGRGQVITQDWDEAAQMMVYAGGSDLRGDGAAIPL
ncbi:putative gamma-glutamyltransferase YwrD [Cyphellophora attinorum]|uniref:Putative gamma-glutamyltransferase YwrD n=1 Tax=Cyphellophora attinorum TaxID=1664694 RepID=A0A0N1H9K0_9EURO|nr:putative gamma-glutamyltransferase YwrD [Phialophora attinorum]KPI40334.1 putative gamma-glutamyltransferase YwrD [Phialophora attinorum]